MQLLGKSKQLKIPENGVRSPASFQSVGVGSSDQISGMSINKDINKKHTRGNSINSGTTATQKQGAVMQHNFRFANELSDDGMMLKGLSNDLIKIKAGPVELNDKCLSCTG